MSVTTPSVSLNSALAGSGLNSAPAINPATEPAAIRNGDATAKQAYQVGVSFEQMLVTQLTQELASTATDSGDDSSDGSSDGSSGDSSGASGLMGSDPASSAYASMLPQTMTSSIMAGGGTGIALQIARSIDPALAHPTANQSDPTSGAKS
jgi:Rod binding domain-containing protein